MSDQLARIQSLLDLGRPEEAAQVAAEALTTDPDNAELLAARAEALVEFDPKSALEPAQRAVTLAPDQPLIMRSLLRVQWRAGKLQPALETADRLRTMAPEMPEAHAWRSGVLVSQIAASNRRVPKKRDLAEAKASAERAIEVAPWWPSAHVMLGRVLLIDGRADDATAAAGTALQLDPNSAMAHELMGDIHQMQGNIREAGDHYVSAGKASPDAGATSRLRELERPALIAGGIGAFFVARLLVTALRVSGSTPIVALVIIVAVVVGLYLLYRRRQAKARAALSTEARDVL
ncbi:MAG: tetratricopeptide repeat protein, partial [Actinomycetota bacterium]